METKIYAVQLSGSLKDSEIVSLLNCANVYCRKKYENTKIKSRAEASLVANALVLFALKDAFGLDVRKIRLGTLSSGKPVLLGCDNIFFSISHCDGLVACAVSRTPVGIDVEKIRKHNPLVAGRFLSPMQTERIEFSENKDEAFTREWTVFEAGAKLFGDGIFKYRHTPLFSFETIRFGNCFISVATCPDN